MEHEKPAPKAEKRRYTPSKRERTALREHRDRGAVARPAPRVAVVIEGAARKFETDHPDGGVAKALLMEAVGTADPEFFSGLLNQLADANSHGGQIYEADLNFMLSVVKGVKPGDQTEAMLAAQMAAVHMATMTFARRLARVETIEQQDSAERAFNKLARTFASQMEALKRYRSGGEQKVTVQHVSVSEGGQAIVGNVTQAAPKRALKSQANTPPALGDCRRPAMTIIGEQQPAPAESAA